jgi:DNA-directed RNA polymerase alpha subunit
MLEKIEIQLKRGNWEAARYELEKVIREQSRPEELAPTLAEQLPPTVAGPLSRHLGAIWLADLQKFTAQELLEVPNFGVTSLRKVKICLRRYRLKLRKRL